VKEEIVRHARPTPFIDRLCPAMTEDWLDGHTQENAVPHMERHRRS
jgi:hypothetical protein